MNLKKAGVIGAIIWAIIFIEVILLNFVSGSIPQGAYYSIHYIFLAIISVLGCNYYFNASKGKRSKEKIVISPMEGIKAGVIFIATGIILDMIITIPVFMQLDYVSFFMDFTLLLGFLEILIISGIVGALKEKKVSDYYRVNKKR